MNRILNSKFFPVFLLFVIFWLGNSLVNLGNQRKAVDSEVNSYEAKVSEAEKNNKGLSSFLKYLENPSFLEREARLKYNYKKDDEYVAFVYPDNSPGHASQSFGELLKSMPNWKKWGYWLSGLLI